MPPKPPRQTVNDLGAAPAIRPAAQGMDSYVRPGQDSIGAPPKVNELTQLSAALSHLEPRLAAYHQQAVEAEIEEDIAKAREIHMGPTRDGFNQLIDKGAIARGQSPFVAKLVDRMQLTQHGRGYQSELTQSFHTSPEFEQARSSNSPDALTAAIGKFHTEWSSRNGFGEDPANPKPGDPYNRLDIQEVLSPHIDNAGKEALQAWTSHRIKAKEQDAIAATGAMIGDELERFSALSVEYNEDGGEVALGQLAGQLERIGRDPVNGVVPNGAQTATEYNQLVVDSVVSSMVKAHNPFLKNVLLHMKTNDGKSSVATTKYAREKIQAAEEHIATKIHEYDSIREWNDTKGHREASRQQTEKSWAWAEQSHNQAQETFARTKSTADRAEVMRTGEIAAYNAADSGRADELRGILKGLRQTDAGAAKKVEEDIGALINHRHDMQVPNSDANDLKVANFGAAIQANPMAFTRGTLIRSMRNHEITGAQEERLASQLTDAQQRGGHEFMQHADYKHAITALTHAVGKDPYDPANTLAQLQVPHALTDLNIAAVDFLEHNPKASNTTFQKFVNEQLETIAKRHSETVKEQTVDRGKALKDAKDKQDAADKQKKKDEESREEQRKFKDETIPKIKKQEANIAAKDKAERTDEGRLILHLPDGSIETEKSMTFQDFRNANRWTNYPTIFGGEHVSEEEAKRIFYDNDGVDPDTGKKARYYYSLGEAEIGAKERSRQLGLKYGQKGKEPDSPSYPTPGQHHYRALRNDPTAENIAAFRKHFGPKSLSENYGQ